MSNRAQRRFNRLVLRRQRFEEVAAMMQRITGYLDALNPDPFLMYDGPSGYGYRRIPLNTFYQDNLFPVDEDEPGITIPWPPGEVQVVARLFHLAIVEQMHPHQILRVLQGDAWDARVAAWTLDTIHQILQDTTYQRIGLNEADPYRLNMSRWTLVALTPTEDDAQASQTTAMSWIAESAEPN